MRGADSQFEPAYHLQPAVTAPYVPRRGQIIARAAMRHHGGVRVNRLTVSALSRSAPSVAPPNPPPHQTRGCQHNEKTGQPGTCGAVSSEYRGDRELNKRVKQKNRVAEDLSPICESRRKGEADPKQAKANRGDNDNDRSN